MGPQTAADEDQTLQAPLLPHRSQHGVDQAAAVNGSCPAAGDAVLVSLQDEQQQQSIGQSLRGTHWLLTTAIMLSDMFGLGWVQLLAPVHAYVLAVWCLYCIMCRAVPACLRLDVRPSLPNNLAVAAAAGDLDLKAVTNSDVALLVQLMLGFLQYV
jgi:hypothetical protein